MKNRILDAIADLFGVGPQDEHRKAILKMQQDLDDLRLEYIRGRSRYQLLAEEMARAELRMYRLIAPQYPGLVIPTLPEIEGMLAKILERRAEWRLRAERQRAWTAIGEDSGARVREALDLPPEALIEDVLSAIGRLRLDAERDVIDPTWPIDDSVVDEEPWYA